MVHPNNTTGGIQIALETSDTTPGGYTSCPKNQTRGLEDQDKNPRQQSMDHTESNDFKRQPRRKTRDDRYEYKGLVPANEHASRSRRYRKKRLHRARKHTLNDEFHASNVASQRLTLRVNTNMGIFNKGKASSPINLRGGLGTRFCEEQFLLQNHKKPSELPVSLDEQRGNIPEKNNGHYQRLSHYFAPQPREDIVGMPTRTKNGPHQIPSDRRETSKIYVRHCEQPDSLAAGPDIRGDCRGTQDIRGDPKERMGQRDQGSRSATPYTWSESERLGSYPSSQLNHVVELRLLDILHTGISAHEDNRGVVTPQLQRVYHSLQDLKGLLESRKSSWETTSPTVWNPENGSPQLTKAVLDDEVEQQQGLSLATFQNPTWEAPTADSHPCHTSENLSSIFFKQGNDQQLDSLSLLDPQESFLFPTTAKSPPATPPTGFWKKNMLY
ncbi:hypothetical protein N7462_001964 [Penicillium macrosclerotiorum]|uniref:uncharacterized protein n=1 Tax=Penicillium macrosclerotiorum TaxID=303699 RepID=UPI0025497094|nr:uncharacterized protein N7462_001964 [Penicillium macrosclerotiorum]KAJ5692541.1 hypothetical protein N7462_001964 [Penicillium macrosclerotiorum]